MIKHYLVLVIICLAVCSVSVIGEEKYPILDKQVEIRQAHLEWKSKIQEIGMKSSISYINQISNDTGVSELSSILDEFTDQTDLISTLTTHIALNNAIRQLIKITTDFRQELRDLIKEYSGKGFELLQRIKTALDENESVIIYLENSYWQIKETNALEIFDTRIDTAQHILNLLYNRSYNTTQAQDKLDEIKDKRNELENAYDQKDTILIRTVNAEIFQLSKELREIVRDLQITVPRDRRVQFWIRVGERAVDRTGIIITELERLGINTTELEEIHSQAEADIQLAKEKFAQGDIDGAIDALYDLKTDFIDLRDAYNDLIFGGVLLGDIETTVERVSDALTDTIDAIEADL
jgi:hypothetical protein